MLVTCKIKEWHVIAKEVAVQCRNGQFREDGESSGSGLGSCSADSPRNAQATSDFMSCGYERLITVSIKSRWDVQMCPFSLAIFSFSENIMQSLGPYPRTRDWRLLFVVCFRRKRNSNTWNVSLVLFLNIQVILYNTFFTPEKSFRFYTRVCI